MTDTATDEDMETQATTPKLWFVLIVLVGVLLDLVLTVAFFLAAAFGLVWGAFDAAANGFDIVNGTIGVASLSYLLYRVLHHGKIGIARK